MTVQYVCAVFDEQMQAFAQPFFVPSTGVATRSFVDEVNRAESPMAAHPEDYKLVQLGTFNLDTGHFTNEQRMLIMARDAIKRKETR